MEAKRLSNIRYSHFNTSVSIFNGDVSKYDQFVLSRVQYTLSCSEYDIFVKVGQEIGKLAHQFWISYQPKHPGSKPNVGQDEDAAPLTEEEIEMQKSCHEAQLQKVEMVQNIDEKMRKLQPPMLENMSYDKLLEAEQRNKDKQLDKELLYQRRIEKEHEDNDLDDNLASSTMYGSWSHQQHHQLQERSWPSSGSLQLARRRPSGGPINILGHDRRNSNNNNILTSTNLTSNNNNDIYEEAISSKFDSEVSSRTVSNWSVTGCVPEKPPDVVTLSESLPGDQEVDYQRNASKRNDYIPPIVCSNCPG